jgi:hypothetical protein
MLHLSRDANYHGRMKALPRHQCLIYEGAPSKQLDSLAQTLIKKLKANHRCLYLNSPAMVHGMRCCLAAAGFNVAAHTKKGALIMTSHQNHLVNGRFDVENMLDLVRVALAEALAGGYRGLWATGDMTWEFGNECNLDKLVEYEQRLEEFMEANPGLSGVCQYHRNTLPLHAVATALDTHKAVYINQTLSRLNPHYALS